MDDQFVMDMLGTLDTRTARIEQFLPTLATRTFVETAIADAIAPLATKQDLADAIAPLSTKSELQQSFQELRRHFDVVGESLRGDMRVLADGILGLKDDVRDLRRVSDRHEERLVSLHLDVVALKGDVTGLKRDVAGLKIDVAALQQQRW